MSTEELQHLVFGPGNGSPSTINILLRLLVISTKVTTLFTIAPRWIFKISPDYLIIINF